VFRWQSPTEGLLRPFGEELLSRAPEVGESFQQMNADIDK